MQRRHLDRVPQKKARHGPAQVSADALEVADAKVPAGRRVVGVGAAEGGLERVAAVCELAPAHHPARALLAPADVEPAVGVAEAPALCPQLRRKQTGPVRLRWRAVAVAWAVAPVVVVAAVHEDVALGAVAVQVHEHGDLALAAHPLHERLGVVDGRMKSPVRLLPPAVEVAAGQAGPIRAEDHAVRVEHGHDLEDERVAQALGLWRVPDEELDAPLHHPRCVGLPRMHARRDNHVLFPRRRSGRGGRRAGVGDGENIAAVPGEGAAQQLAPEDRSDSRVRFDLCKEAL